MGLTPDSDLMSELQDLKTRGEQFQRDSQATQRKIFDLLGIPEHSAVTVVFDARGLMSEIEFDKALRVDLTPEELVQQINIAILRDGAVFGQRVASVDGSPVNDLSPPSAVGSGRHRGRESARAAEICQRFRDGQCYRGHGKHLRCAL
jgi:hypothetical protein